MATATLRDEVERGEDTWPPLRWVTMIQGGDHVMDNIGILAVALGGLGLATSLWIAYRQDRQIAKLHVIGSETQDITKELLVEPRKRINAEKLFRVQDLLGKQYAIMFPGNYNKHPLHQIVAGDYFALSVISNALGPKRVSYHPIPAVGKIRIPDRDLIFICTPSVNSALERFLPPFNFKNGQLDGTHQGPSTKLPCWFCHDQVGDRTFRKIAIFESKGVHLLPSPAEQYYEAASLRPHGEIFDPRERVQTDYAIFLRLRVEGRRIYVVAGIHSYGTWVAAEYLERLLSDRNAHEELPLSSDDDLAAIIVGDFVSREMRVDRVSIFNDHVWHRKGTRWVQWDHKAARA